MVKLVTERRPGFDAADMSHDDILYMLGRINSHLMEHGSVTLESGTVESAALIRAWSSYVDP